MKKNKLIAKLTIFPRAFSVFKLILFKENLFIEEVKEKGYVENLKPYPFFIFFILLGTIISVGDSFFDKFLSIIFLIFHINSLNELSETEKNPYSKNILIYLTAFTSVPALLLSILDSNIPEIIYSYVSTLFIYAFIMLFSFFILLLSVYLTVKYFRILNKTFLFTPLSKIIIRYFISTIEFFALLCVIYLIFFMINDQIIN